MKRFLFLICLIGFGWLSNAQTFNNEWIDYNKTYYKFKIGTTGVYRISQTNLSSLGLGSTPAEHFQLWRNGQQIPIYTSVPSGPIGAGGYIEFWGEQNDGKPDNQLYKDPTYQLSNKYSFQSDTATFFLTVNPVEAISD